MLVKFVLKRILHPVNYYHNVRSLKQRVIFVLRLQSDHKQSTIYSEALPREARLRSTMGK